MNIGLIGTGTIGKFLLEKINMEKVLPGYNITAIFDEREKAKATLPDVAQKFNVDYFHELEEFLHSDVELVVECANVESVQKYAPQILSKKSLLVISVGALVDPRFYEELQSSTKNNNTKLFLPSGAIGGLDVIKSANVTGELNEVALITRKPAKALSIGELRGEEIIFEGKAKDAIKQFPQNANVAITLSLAGIGVDLTEVKIIADPTIDKNTHTIEAKGEFGSISFTLENNPSPTNPKTSYLTSLSVLSSLKSLDEQVVVG